MTIATLRRAIIRGVLAWLATVASVAAAVILADARRERTLLRGG